MQNYKQPGDVLTLTAPYDVDSGDGLKVGGIFGVATGDAAETESVEAQTSGVFSLAKVSAQEWVQGDRIYWNDTDKVCSNVATVGQFIGLAIAAAANPSSTGQVLLCRGPELLEGQQAAVADVATADADTSYGQPEADLLNELKAQLNDLLAKLRIQGIIAS